MTNLSKIPFLNPIISHTSLRALPTTYPRRPEMTSTPKTTTSPQSQNRVVVVFVCLFFFLFLFFFNFILNFSITLICFVPFGLKGGIEALVGESSWYELNHSSSSIDWLWFSSSSLIFCPTDSMAIALWLQSLIGAFLVDWPYILHN